MILIIKKKEKKKKKKLELDKWLNSGFPNRLNFYVVIYHSGGLHSTSHLKIKNFTLIGLIIKFAISGSG